MEVQVSAAGPLEADVQALAVAVFKDEKPLDGELKELDSASGGLLSSVVESDELKGKEGETAYLLIGEDTGGMKARRLLLIGVGERKDYGAAQAAQFAGAAVRFLRGKNIKS